MTPGRETPVTADARIGRAWRELRRGASMQTLRSLLYGAGPGTLELGQVDALQVLVLQPAWRMGELARALRIDRSTATRTVARLVTDGLAERTDHPGDARGVVVRATARGRAVHRRLAERGAKVLHHVLRDFDPAERRALAELLERLVDGVDAFVADDAAAASVR